MSTEQALSLLSTHYLQHVPHRQGEAAALEDFVKLLLRRFPPLRERIVTLVETGGWEGPDTTDHRERGRDHVTMSHDGAAAGNEDASALPRVTDNNQEINQMATFREVDNTTRASPPPVVTREERLVREPTATNQNTGSLCHRETRVAVPDVREEGRVT